MSKNYENMLDALRTSVIEIVNANPADRDAKLEKTFASYSAALSKRLNEDMLLPIEEHDPVTVLGDRIGRLNEVVDALEKGLCPGAELLSEQALLLSKSVVEFGGLVLNAAAADFAEPTHPDDEVQEGMGLYKVASHTQGEEILVKSVLPPAAAALTADPADTSARLVEFFMEGLGWLGVPVKLAKRMPAQLARGKGPAEAEDEGDDADADADDAANEDDEQEMSEDGDPDEEEGMMGDDEEGQPDQPDMQAGNPLERIARAGTLALLELDQLREQIGDNAMTGEDGQMSALDAMGQHLALVITGAQALSAALDDGADMPEGADPEGAAPMQDAEPEEALKATPNAGLEKSTAAVLAKAVQENAAAQEALQKAKDDARALQAKVDELSKYVQAPAAPKASTGVGVQVLSKEGDASGAAPESVEDQAARLAKMTPEAAALELTKMAFQNPVAISG